MIEHSQTFADLAKALCAAQAEMTSAVKDAANPHFGKRYASLDAVIDAVRGPLTRHGLSFVQAPGSLDEAGLPITTMLMHTSGEFMRSTLHVPVTKRDAQGIGSCISYGRRYSLMSILGIAAADDDDAEAGMGRTGKADQQPPRQPEPEPEPHPADIYIKDAERIISLIESPEEGRAWWEYEKPRRQEAWLNQDDTNRLKAALTARIKAISPPPAVVA